jgi:predicted transcriptional regulator
MTTLTIQIDKEKDLSALEEVLHRLGLNYQVQDNDWAGLSEVEIEGIKAGLADVEAGRTFTHDEAVNRMANKLKQLGID